MSKARELALLVLEEHRTRVYTIHDKCCAIHSYSGRANPCTCTPQISGCNCVLCKLAVEIIADDLMRAG